MRGFYLFLLTGSCLAFINFAFDGAHLKKEEITINELQNFKSEWSIKSNLLPEDEAKSHILLYFRKTSTPIYIAHYHYLFASSWIFILSLIGYFREGNFKKSLEQRSGGNSP